jgi:DNA-directed RNA polymerase subunit alpha
MEFLLNVKALRVKPNSDRAGKLVLEAVGEGSVCAGDIQPSADFAVINPELHLATLEAADARLNVEFDIELGMGYREAEPGDSLPEEVIGVDAIFTPIRKVNYNVEPTYIGRDTNYERLTIEIWTDGTISPVDAVSQSAEIMVEQLTPFAGYAGLSQIEEKERIRRLAIPEEKYNMPVEQLELSVRTMNCLRAAGITTVGEIVSKGEKELIQLRNFGRKSKQEIEQRLTEIGLSLAGETDNPGAEAEDTSENEKGEASTSISS